MANQRTVSRTCRQFVCRWCERPQSSAFVGSYSYAEVMVARLCGGACTHQASACGVELHSPSMDEMVRFRDRLNDKGIIATIRTSRGQDIDAACGLLSTKEKNN